MSAEVARLAKQLEKLQKDDFEVKFKSIVYLLYLESDVI